MINKEALQVEREFELHLQINKVLGATAQTPCVYAQPADKIKKGGTLCQFWTVHD